jgi:hypothetical protein
MSDELHHFDAPLRLELRDEAKREISARLFEWDVPGETDTGPELIERGALDGVDPANVMLTLDHEGPAIGRAIALESRDDGPHAIFRVAKTARGDEAMALTAPGADDEPALYRHVSVAFTRAPFDALRSVGGRSVGVRKKIDLRAVGLTWHPAHKGAAILEVREGDPTVGENVAPEPNVNAISEALLERLEKLEERSRSVIEFPTAPAPKVADKGKWVQYALRSLTGERVSDLEMRELADVVTSDNMGVVPVQIKTELIGLIDPVRRFLGSTRQVPAGDSGVEIQFPVLEQRPKVDTQSSEKDELASQATKITSTSFTAVTKGGAGDISMQLLKRSSPAFLNLWLELLAEAYAINTDESAVEALLDAEGIEDGGEFDPAHPIYGAAFENAMSVGRLMLPDRMWLSTAALVAMIDAKTPSGGGGTAMYPGLVNIEGITSGAGGGPLPISMRPVHVPALDGSEVDVVIGPSRGFAWAEDGTYTLQADVPAKFGRDVALAGMIWYMPLYPGAFTTYTLPEASA